MATTEAQECFVCKAQFTDLDLFWKHIYEVECEAPDSGTTTTTVAITTNTTTSLSSPSDDINATSNNAAVAPVTTTVNTSPPVVVSSNEHEEKENQPVPPPSDPPHSMDPPVSKRNLKSRKRKQGNSTKSLPDHSRESSCSRGNYDFREQRQQPMVSNGLHSSSSLKSLNRFNVNTFKRDKPAMLYCDLCNVPIPSMAALEQHESGRRHLKALGRGSESDSNNSSLIKCDIYSTRTETVHPAQPVSTISKPAPAESRPIPRFSVNTDSSGIWCTDCNVLLGSDEEFQSHRESFKHRSALAWKQRNGSAESPSSNPEDVYGYQKPDSSASLKRNPIPTDSSGPSNDMLNSPKPVDTKSILRKVCLTQLLSLMADTDPVLGDLNNLDAHLIRQTQAKCRDELIHMLRSDLKLPESAQLELGNKHVDSIVSKYAPPAKTKGTDFDKLLQSITVLSWCRQLQLLD